MMPQLMAASAKLNIGLKKQNAPLPPMASIPPISVDDGEIKHVYHTTVEQASYPVPNGTNGP